MRVHEWWTGFAARRYLGSIDWAEGRGFVLEGWLLCSLMPVYGIVPSISVNGSEEGIEVVVFADNGSWSDKVSVR